MPGSVSYAEAKRVSKMEDTWDKGEIEGIAAAEAANNATSGANLIPLLTLGIPGSTSTALLAGVMLIHGITIGPSVLVEPFDLIYGLFAAGLLCILTYFVTGYWGSNLVGRMIPVVPSQMIYPWIFITCFVAAYAIRLAIFELALMTFFGVVGLLLKKFNFNFSIPHCLYSGIRSGGVATSGDDVGR